LPERMRLAPTQSANRTLRPPCVLSSRPAKSLSKATADPPGRPQD
jgi:hypothetical protein